MEVIQHLEDPLAEKEMEIMVKIREAEEKYLWTLQEDVIASVHPSPQISLWRDLEISGPSSSLKKLCRNRRDILNAKFASPTSIRPVNSKRKLIERVNDRDYCGKDQETYSCASSQLQEPVIEYQGLDSNDWTIANELCRCGTNSSKIGLSNISGLCGQIGSKNVAGGCLRRRKVAGGGDKCKNMQSMSCEHLQSRLAIDCAWYADFLVENADGAHQLGVEGELAGLRDALLHIHAAVVARTAQVRRPTPPSLHLVSA
jgi:hypothetical protein